MRRGWYGESNRHSLARQGIKTGRKLNLKKQRRVPFRTENLTKRELDNLIDKQLDYLQKGKTFTSDDYIKERTNQIKRINQERYKKLATGQFIGVKDKFYGKEDEDLKQKFYEKNAKRELEEYRKRKADYLQYLDEKKKVEEFLKKYKGTKGDLRSQKYTETLLQDLKTEYPRTYEYIMSKPDYKLYVLDENDYDELSKELIGAKSGFSYGTKGLHDRHSKTILVKTKLNNPTPSDRLETKEVIVHEFSHAKNQDNNIKNIKNEWRNSIKPAIKNEFGLVKKRLTGKITKDEYKKESKKIDEKLGKITTFMGGNDANMGLQYLEYPAYHNQYRYVKRLNKKYYDKVLEQEKKGNYELPLNVDFYKSNPL